MKSDGSVLRILCAVDFSEPGILNIAAEVNPDLIVLGMTKGVRSLQSRTE